MANLITADALGEHEFVQLSNGSTSVLFSTLLLAGSDLAESAWEVKLMQFLAGRDQNVFGIGMVGFDLGDIGWERVSFEEQKSFLLRVIDLAMSRHRWEALGYDPPFVHKQLGELRALVDRWAVDCVRASSAAWDIWARTGEPAKCTKHGVFKNAEECLICGDAPVG